MGGNYDKLGGEKQRNMIGNALMNMSLTSINMKNIVKRRTKN